MLVEVEVFSGAASSSLYSAGFFPVVHTPIRACRHGDRHHLINAISVEEERKGAPNLIRRTRRVSGQVRQRAAPTFQSGFNLSLGRVLLSVPLEQLKDQTESLRFAAPGAHAPQINGQLPRHRYDSFFARCPGSKRAFG